MKSTQMQTHSLYSIDMNIFNGIKENSWIFGIKPEIFHCPWQFGENLWQYIQIIFIIKYFLFVFSVHYSSFNKT